MTSGEDDLLFGRLALHYKLITRSQLEEVHGLQSLAGGRRKLTDMLVEMGYLTPRQVEQVLAVQRDYLAKRREQAAAAMAALPAVPAIGAQAVPAPPSPAPPEATAPAAAIGPGIAPAAGTVLPALDPRGGSPLPPLAADDTLPVQPTPVPLKLGAPSPPRAVDAILEEALRQGASDIHLHSCAPLSVRRLGELVAVGPEPLPAATTERMVRELLTPEQWDRLRVQGQVDFACDLPGGGRFRANAFRQQRGVDAVFRAIPSQPPTLAGLHLPESLARLADFHQGMVLITGPAGCGKSSTLAALIDIINSTRRDHIVTIEDPIEYIHTSKQCIVNQRQVGSHTGSFPRALRASFREDPDVIAIGELRDLETTGLAITAAETGHLVLGTLHTNNAIRTINRVLGVFPPNLQAQMRAMVAESLRAVVSQQLVPRADGSGRVPAIEVLIVTKAVSNLIRDSKTFQIRSVLQTGGTHGMVQLDTSLHELVKAGVVSREEALRHAEEPQKFPA
ncbi:MAG TPA: type IV pilus twitching motility protein PilT [Thermoanaerobaculia bacterium]|nr:type IV pilus twitching motility protein PilT [Thermoanaerobaculia bacterium]